MRALVVGLAGLVVVVGCKKEPGAGGAASPAPPASATEQDALWKLAPDGAIAGFVASARGVELVERALLAARSLLATSDLAPLSQPLEDMLRKEIGAPNSSLADLGLTHDRGFALFVTGNGHIAMVLPVGDRDKFLARVHGKRGADDDELDGGACRTLDGRYVCVQDRLLLAKLGRGGLDATRRAAGARGDLEFAGHDFTGRGGPSVAVVAQLVSGAITIRGTVGGIPRSVTDLFGTPVKPRAGSSAASGFGVVDLTPYLAMLPPVPIARGITLGQLGKTIAGPLTVLVPAGTADLGIRIALTDPTAAKNLVEHCADLPALAISGATVKDGACRVPVPQIGADVEARVDGQELRIGARTAAAQATSIIPSALAAELAGSAWSLAFFSRGSYLDLKALPGASAALQALPSESAMFLRAAPLLNELGFGIRKDSDAVHVVFGVRTAWANPDDVVRKLLAISFEDLLSGKAAETGKSIAAAAPGSAFAQDFKAGPGGLLGLTAPVGILAAVAIPAFMDYMKRSKKTEASLQLNKIGKNAKRAYAETSEFPRGTAPLVTAAPCCGQDMNRCQSTAKDWQHPVWQALDFEIDEPSLFQYSYESDGKTFTAKAIGDLDCDGIMITYQLDGKAENGNPTVTLTEPPVGAD